MVPMPWSTPWVAPSARSRRRTASWICTAGSGCSPLRWGGLAARRRAERLGGGRRPGEPGRHSGRRSSGWRLNAGDRPAPMSWWPTRPRRTRCRRGPGPRRHRRHPGRDRQLRPGIARPRRPADRRQRLRGPECRTGGPVSQHPSHRGGDVAGPDQLMTRRRSRSRDRDGSGRLPRPSGVFGQRGVRIGGDVDSERPAPTPFLIG